MWQVQWLSLLQSAISSFLLLNLIWRAIPIVSNSKYSFRIHLTLRWASNYRWNIFHHYWNDLSSSIKSFMGVWFSRYASLFICSQVLFTVYSFTLCHVGSIVLLLYLIFLQLDLIYPSLLLGGSFHCFRMFQLMTVVMTRISPFPVSFVFGIFFFLMGSVAFFVLLWVCFDSTETEIVACEIVTFSDPFERTVMKT